MIHGRFGERIELFFEIGLVAADGESFPVEVLLDTGFTTGWLALDTQDCLGLGWVMTEREQVMQTVRGEEYFDIYEGRVVLNEQDYIIAVLAGDGVSEPILGLQWLRKLPLTVDFEMGILTLG
ncbi:MAG: aspartyl protease [Coleofasciculaceae cyanobacterium SM2_1_6]|nr:aspartyl protease [Coleofasciculaceae cyanobacterium SM2_1_6]